MLSLVRLGYLLSLLMTPFADVFGRRRLLLYTVFGYTIFTGLIAIAPGERTFVVFEIIARVFAGAEAAIAMVIVAEEVDAAIADGRSACSAEFRRSATDWPRSFSRSST